MTESSNTQLKTSASQFLDSLFRDEFGDQTEYDPQVVELIQEHLAQRALHPKAGLRLAEALIQLAKARAAEGNQ